MSFTGKSGTQQSSRTPKVGNVAVVPRHSGQAAMPSSMTKIPTDVPASEEEKAALGWKGHSRASLEQDAPPFLQDVPSNLPVIFSHSDLITLVAASGCGAQPGLQARAGSSSGREKQLGLFHDVDHKDHCYNLTEDSTRLNRLLGDQAQAEAGSNSISSSVSSNSGFITRQQQAGSAAAIMTWSALERAAACPEAHPLREGVLGVRASATGSATYGCHSSGSGGLGRGDERPGPAEQQHRAVPAGEASRSQETIRSDGRVRVNSSDGAEANPTGSSSAEGVCLPAELQSAVSAGWISQQDAQGIVQVLARIGNEKLQQPAIPGSTLPLGGTAAMVGPGERPGGLQLLEKCSTGSFWEGLLRVDSVSGVTGVVAAALPVSSSSLSHVSQLPGTPAAMSSIAEAYEGIIHPRSTGRCFQAVAGDSASPVTGMRGLLPVALPHGRGSEMEAMLRANEGKGQLPSLLPLPSLPSLAGSLQLMRGAARAVGRAERPLEMVAVRALTEALAVAVMVGDVSTANPLLRELRAASSLVGPASQRMAHYYANALAARIAGTGLQAYLSEVPPDARAFEEAWIHFAKSTPFAYFFACCAGASVMAALDMAGSRASDMRGNRQSEHLHIIDINFETAYFWMGFLPKLAARPHGPPKSLRISLIDAQQRFAAGARRGRERRGRQLRDQLSVQAAVVGILDFECEVIHCFVDAMQDGLGRVTFSEERLRKIDEERWGQKKKDEELRSGLEGNSCTFARMADVLQEVKRCKQQLERGWGRPMHAGSHGTAGSVVDVLAVCDVMALSDYMDEAGAGPSARESFLSWAHSLCPDVFLSIQLSLEASGPFLVPRVTESFNHCAAFSLFHDFITTQQDTGTDSRGHHQGGNHQQNSVSQHLSERQPGRQCKDSRVTEETEGAEGEGTLGDFKLCLPETRMEQCLVAYHRNVPCFQKTLERHHTLLCERFMLLRPIAIIVGTEGLLRFIRPWSHEHWHREMSRCGFVHPVTFPLVTSQVCFMMQGLPECVTVTPTRSGLALAFCGKDVIHASFWTVEFAL